MILDIIVIILIILLAYTWVGYPCLLMLVSKEHADNSFPNNPTTQQPSNRACGEATSVSILFAAHNEEGVIGARLDNLIDIIGERDVEVHVGLDGCTDATAETARSTAKGRKNIYIHEFSERRGKVAVLKNLVKEISLHDYERLENQREEVPISRSAEGLAYGNRQSNIGRGGQEEENKKDRINTSAAQDDLCDSFASRSSRSSCEKTNITDTQHSASQRNEPNNDSLQNEKRILVFTDANTHFKEDVLAELLAPFADKAVGGVCGRLVFVERAGEEILNRKDVEADKKDCINTSVEQEDLCSSFASRSSRPLELHSLGDGGYCEKTSKAPEGFYWSWETKLKVAESRLDSCLGANGAIYAVREELFWSEMPDNTVVDDFVIGMKVREQGYKMIYEPAAIAEEELPELKNEWGRRIRIGSGDYQALSLCRKCLSPRYGTFAWSFLSHKVLRWLTPHMLLVLIPGFWLQVLNGWLFIERNGFFRSTLSVASGMIGSGLILLFVLSSLLGSTLRNAKSRLTSPFRLCDHFMTMQAALFAGFIRYCRGDLKGFWTRTPR